MRPALLYRTDGVGVAANRVLLEHAWDLVLARAGVDPDRFHLLPVPGAAVAGYNKAACYPPGELLVDDPDDLLRGELLREANAPEHRANHRIAIYEDINPEDDQAMAVLLGKLRHEVRHAEQRDACGQALFDLDELAGELCSYKVGGLPGGAFMYHLKPVEADANAAAAELLRSEGVQDLVLASSDAVLARSNTPPGDLADLPAKTVAFMFTLREVADQVARQAQAERFADLLAAINPHYGAQWLALGRQPSSAAPSAPPPSQPSN